MLFGALFLVGGAATIFVAGGGASTDMSQATSRSGAITRVTVTATDSTFRLSRRSVPTGTVIFTIINKGKISHDFKIAGKKTPLLTPRHSATLRVAFPRKGRYPYVSTVSGQASAGMKGIFVVAAPTPPAAPTAPTTTTSTTVGTANTTVTVDMFDPTPPGFHRLSQRTIPSGMVTWRASRRARSSTRVSRRRGRSRWPRAPTASIATCSL
jgi:plastocyanin